MKRKIDVSAAIMLIVAAAFLAFDAGCLFMRWRMPEKTKIDEVKEVIDQLYVGEYDMSELEEYAAAAMVDALGDRWSYYLTEEYLQQYLQDSNNEYYGIGITVQQTDDVIIVQAVERDSPAALAGILPGGQLQSVDGQSVAGMDTTEVKGLVQAGIAEGEVVLSILEDGVVNEYTLTGDIIQVDPVRYEMMDGIGYIKVKNFDARSAEQLIDACMKLMDQGASGLVFDLRFNPGGQLDELLPALDYLLPEGDLFLSKVKGGEMEAERSDARCVEMPMAVLVNAESYSAAEFFAAALQEYDWATIVGEQTTGKGYAQRTVMLTDGGAVHISAKEYFTPNGVSLADKGITPDIQVDIEEEPWTLLYYDMLLPEEDPQLQAALEIFK